MKKICLGLVISSIIFMLAAAAVADSPAEGRKGRAEVRFMEGMIDHHQMALDMAQDCLAKAQTEAVLALCRAVIEAQTPEIALMQDWLRDWYNIHYEPVAMYPFDNTSGMRDEHQHGSSAATDPAMMMGMMAGLNRLEGIDYEIAWLESMIDHHDDALHMSERILRRAEHPALIDLANAIIIAQTAEIDLMESMISAIGADS